MIKKDSTAKIGDKIVFSSEMPANESNKSHSHACEFVASAYSMPKFILHRLLKCVFSLRNEKKNEKEKIEKKLLIKHYDCFNLQPLLSPCKTDSVPLEYHILPSKSILFPRFFSNSLNTPFRLVYQPTKK